MRSPRSWSPRDEPQKAQRARSITNWLRRVWHLLNRRCRERELIEEMRDHRAAMGRSNIGNLFRAGVEAFLKTGAGVGDQG